MERTNVFLGDVDRARIEALREQYGLTSAGQAIRLALRLATAALEVGAAKPRRRHPSSLAPGDGEGGT